MSLFIIILINITVDISITNKLFFMIFFEIRELKIQRTHTEFIL